MKIIRYFFVFLFVLKSTFAFSKQGLWENVPFPQNKGYMLFTKSMYKNTIVSLKIDCSSETSPTKIKIDWLLRYTPCAQEFQSIEGLKGEATAVNMMMTEGKPQLLFPDFNYDTIEYITDKDNIQICDGSTIFLDPKIKITKDKIEKVPEKTEKAKATTTEKAKETGKKDTAAPARRKREETDTTDKTPASTTGTTTPSETEAVTTNVSKSLKQDQEVDHPSLAKVWKSGYYAFIVRISALNTDEKFDAKLTVAMKGKVGYISAVDWPLLIFYGVMGLVYIIYGLVWLVLLACNWRDLMRLQYWVGGVIVLGMLEKAVFYADYQNIANNGKSVTEGTVIFAEVVSSLKRALARMLVIIVSVGFGIVKPRLGPTFHKVLFVGGLYFILATVEGSMRTLKPKGDQSTDLMLAAVPLAVVDASICWWIFSSLVQTTRQLRLRRNVVKLTLYRHFTNTLIFAVLASIIFMIWSIIQIKMKTCLRAWREIWLDEAYWHLLFSIILAIIMILWRPSSNNQRYAFSPLIDAADDEDEEDESVLNDAFAGMKNRTKQANGSPKQKQNSIEDDLKWVEENIPSTLSDKAQTLIESDEEIMTVKYEMSKMQ
ncbi:transmembrane protein 87A-like [Mercenaria mercenaria]|uniref:transmembrane protein 87A-like n=1 Tax=Mercenaria mercenaria TaxID=6596 RepID=UPI00234E6E0F|nr:transmembrane protein 87A-like [Mercenaria mercenaria]